MRNDTDMRLVDITRKKDGVTIRIGSLLIIFRRVPEKKPSGGAPVITVPTLRSDF